MKKLLQYTVLGLMLASLLLLNSCARSNVADPGMDANAGFFINLSGVANPGLLFVSQGTSPAVSYMTAIAKYNDGSPVMGKNIVFKISDDIGYFPGGSRTAVRATNAQGVCSIPYSVTNLAIAKIGASSMIYIQAWMQVDLYNVFDMIPLQLVTNMPDDGANELSITLIDTGVDPMNIPNSGGTLNYQVFNSKGTDAINFLVTIDSNGTGWVTANLSSGTTPVTLIITIADDSVTLPGAPYDATVLLTATAPTDVVNHTQTITIHQN